MDKDASKEVQAAALAEIDVAAVVAAVKAPEGSKMQVCTWPEWVDLKAAEAAGPPRGDGGGGGGGGAAAEVVTGGGGVKRKRD